MQQQSHGQLIQQLSHGQCQGSSRAADDATITQAVARQLDTCYQTLIRQVTQPDPLYVKLPLHNSSQLHTSAPTQPLDRNRQKASRMTAGRSLFRVSVECVSAIEQPRQKYISVADERARFTFILSSNNKLPMPATATLSSANQTVIPLTTILKHTRGRQWQHAHTGRFPLFPPKSSQDGSGVACSRCSLCW